MSKKLEAQRNTFFMRYLTALKKQGTPLYGYFELKYTAANTFNMSKLEKGQVIGLENMQKYGLQWKLSDQDQRVKPCDCFSAPPITSYVLVFFHNDGYLLKWDTVKKFKSFKKEFAIKNSSLYVKYHS